MAMADRFGFLNDGSSRSVIDEEFDEEDVWAVVKEKKDGSSKTRKPKDSSSGSTPRRLLLPTGSRMISRASNSIQEPKVFQQSAPVNIPDWSKIYRKNSKEGLWMDDDDDVNDNGNSDEVEDDDDEDGYDDEDDRIPPHEWVAKKLARTQISSFSVCEGVGRTLKGRDLSKVRNAVLTRTGFLE